MSVDPILKRYLRDKLPLQIIRGNYTTEPGKLSFTAPPIDGEGIKSGMIIVRATGTVRGVASQPGFRKAEAADRTAENLSFYVAMHDQDSPDVVAANGMVGLDCADDYELQTGYYDTAETWTLDMPLTVGVDGDDNPIIKEALTGDYVIGYITKIGTGNGTLPYVGKTPSTVAADAKVIQFKTARNGQKKV